MRIFFKIYLVHHYLIRANFSKKVQMQTYHLRKCYQHIHSCRKKTKRNCRDSDNKIISYMMTLTTVLMNYLTHIMIKLVVMLVTDRVHSILMMTLSLKLKGNLTTFHLSKPSKEVMLVQETENQRVLIMRSNLKIWFNKIMQVKCLLWFNQ
jgi:hypothetical protein